jgi:hypothetical protein
MFSYTSRLIKTKRFNIAKDILSTHKRTMYTTRYISPLIRPNPLLGNIRNYPNQYSIGHLNYNARTGNGKKLLPHEYGHKLIRRNSDGQLVGVLTTDPKSSFESTLLDPKEYFNGKPVQAGEVGQYATAFNNPKIVEAPIDNNISKPIFTVDPKLQHYADKHEDTFNKFYANKISTPCEIRRHVYDDSHLYNENGTRDYENFP